MRNPSMKLRLGLVFLIMWMDVIGVSLFYPVAPFIVKRYSPDAMMVTMMTILYSSAQFISAPVLGKLSDRLGRRPVLLASIVGSAIGYSTFALSGSLWVLFLSRVINGLSGGSMSTAGAYIADISLPGQRTRNFTLIGLAWGIGLIVGPALGTALGQINIMAPAFFAAGLMLVNIALCSIFLPESLAKDMREIGKLRLPSLNPLQSIWKMLRMKVVGRLLIVSSLFGLAVNGTNSINSLFMIDRFGAAQWLVGAYLVVIGGGVVLLQPVIPLVVKRLGEWRAVAATLLQQAIGGTAIWLSGSLGYFMPVSLLNAWLGNFIYAPVTALQTNSIGEGDIGMLMGVTTSMNSLTNVFGPLWAGFVFDAVSPNAPYLVAAAVLLAAFFVLPQNGAAALLEKGRALLRKVSLTRGERVE